MLTEINYLLLFAILFLILEAVINGIFQLILEGYTKKSFQESILKELRESREFQGKEIRKLKTRSAAYYNNKKYEEDPFFSKKDIRHVQVKCVNRERFK